MTEICLLLLSLAIVLALILAIVVVLKNGKFHFLFKKSKKEDALLVEAEHQDNLDKWSQGASAPYFFVEECVTNTNSKNKRAWVRYFLTPFILFIIIFFITYMYINQ